MKKMLIAAFVGALLLFFWQFLSWSILGIHDTMQAYTPKQVEVIKYLNETLNEGFYYMPNVPPGTSMEENEKAMNEAMGKPWAQVYLHKSLSMSMPLNMGRGLLIDLISLILLLRFILNKGQHSFQEILLSCLALGVISYLTTTYTYSIWYQTKTIGDLIDALVSWGIVGVWLGWWLNRKLT